MTFWLVALMLSAGQLQVGAWQMRSLEDCMQVMPFVASKLPENSRLSCETLKDDKAL